jgi:hypothetical protein
MDRLGMTKMKSSPVAAAGTVPALLTFETVVADESVE